MWATLIVGFALAATTSVAAAQISEAQSRRYLLPYIRATTNCFASEALRTPGLVDAVEEQSLGNFLRRVQPRCSREVDQMIVAHDQVKGYGSGRQFFAGAYWDDLPRAVMTRIEPQIERLTQEREVAATREKIRQSEIQIADAERRRERQKLADERRDRLAELQSARDLLREKMFDCVAAKIDELAPSGEQATMLASAALTMCDNALEDAATAAFRYIEYDERKTLSARDKDYLTTVFRDSVREQAIVFAVRLKAGSAQEKEKGGVRFWGDK